MHREEPLSPNLFYNSGTLRLIVINFGRPECGKFLGGDFLGPESAGDLSWNWCGENKCWCVLPQCADMRYRAVLEAAPLAPFRGELKELVILQHGRHVLRRVVSADADEAGGKFRCALPAPLKRAGESVHVELELQWRKLHAPGVAVSTQTGPITLLEFEPKPELQFREFEVDTSQLSDARALIFTPNLAFSPADIGDTNETRILSFRFFRLTLTPL